MENGFSGLDHGHRATDHAGPGNDEWAEILARTVAHLAAQLTVTQLRLRALASELSEHDAASEQAVRERLHTLAANESGDYLRANLGEALLEIIDVEELEESVKTYLSDGA